MNKSRFYTLALSVILVFTGLGISQTVKAQQHEIGLGLGAGTYTGDILRIIDPNQLGIQGTLFGRRNFDNAWSLRAGFSIARLNGADSIRPLDQVAATRNAFFNGTMAEVSARMEFHFIDYMSHKSTSRFSPFGFFGLGYGLFFGQGQSYEGDIQPGNYSLGTVILPFGAGIKYKLKDRILLSFEGGAKATFTDNLDKIGDESIYLPRYRTDPGTGNQVLEPTSINFGNSSDRDWYYFLGFTISYSFHQIKCY
ncbi:DUF6089 family protein [Cyclobacterium sp. 1_MG-2023]|uniref:type IX secretion system protein PorG n=1 Tax=Cyclobacterium sp. 1_MG-2023 TaxID=3062681 RepID=UPI0026E1B71C|nr:DUF6089 family protein [Cyclobacterium sp. 1_MG-2023]MDO6438130.1 DUF6089 family protein [Cyclobacterium sp. 1_MG-2023]